MKVVGKNNLKNKQYIYCPNHTSFIDILSILYSLKANYVFIGKSSIEKIPLFGYMYRKLYITVNRNNIKSRAEAIKQGSNKLKKGISLVIFPEGGIPNHTPPKLGLFKEGAFRLAIEHNIPIVPVSLLNNWNVLPDNQFRIRRKKMKIIFHKPIEPHIFGTENSDALKNETFHVLEKSIQNYLKNENQ